MHGPPDPPRTGEAHEALLTPWRCRCGWENRPTNGVCGGGRRHAISPNLPQSPRLSRNLPQPSAISPDLPLSPAISRYLPLSPPISPNLTQFPKSPPISRRPYGCGVNRAVGCPDYRPAAQTALHTSSREQRLSTPAAVNRPATAAQTSLHVADLASTKGTFLDTGDGVWRRLQQQTPIRVPPGGRLRRRGECEV